MTTRTKTIRSGTTNRIKREWDSLQSREHGIDLERAKLLHDVYTRLGRDEALLDTFIVGVLGEYRGKRTKMFVRLALAFDKMGTSETETWNMIGGSSMVLFARVRTARQRRRVLTRVRRTLATTKRSTISGASFRTILKDVLGAEYSSVLNEFKSGPTGGNLRFQLQILKGFVLSLVKSNPNILNEMSDDVKVALGVDLVE